LVVHILIVFILIC